MSSRPFHLALALGLMLGAATGCQSSSSPKSAAKPPATAAHSTVDPKTVAIDKGLAVLHFGASW